MIRDLELRDLPALEKLPRDFPLPNISSRLIIAKRVIEVDKEIRAVGLLKLTSEALILIDSNCDTQARTIAAKHLVSNLIYTGEVMGLDDCHVFLRPENRRMMNFLKKFKFVEVEDRTMYLPPRSQNGEKGNTVGS